MNAPDRVALLGLRGHGRHGWFAHETEQGQTFVVDVVLHLDTRAAAGSDNLADAVDYGEVGRAVLAVVEGEPVRLIETLAQRVADSCLRDPRIEAVEVVVHKPEAPMTVPFDDIEVRIYRSRT
jgi:7,8-dihydroneopterin aldolase/epimerase/oxygenase